MEPRSTPASALKGDEDGVASMRVRGDQAALEPRCAAAPAGSIARTDAYTSTKDDIAMHEDRSATDPAPASAARMVDLLAAIRGPEDLSPERLQALSGLPVTSAPDDPRRYGAGLAIDAQWIFNIAALPGRGDAPTRIVVAYDRQTPDAADAPDGAPAFEACAGTLCAAGFVQTTIPGPRGVRYGDRFERDGVRIDLQTERDGSGLLRVVRAFIDTPVAATAEVGHG